MTHELEDWVYFTRASLLGSAELLRKKRKDYLVLPLAEASDSSISKNFEGHLLGPTSRALSMSISY
jgi:hypothetical protein